MFGTKYTAFQIALASSIAITGCSAKPYTGIAAHSTGADAPEVLLENPLGLIGVEWMCGVENLRCGFEHHSGLLAEEVGGGYNFGFVKWFLEP